MNKDQETEQERFDRVWQRVEQSNHPDRSASHAASPQSASQPKSSSADQKQFLRQSITDELVAWKSYLRLAGAGTGAKLLQTSAADEFRHARRLSAAYFLMTGIRWFPRQEVAPLVWSSWEAGIRETFYTEQKVSAAYRHAADSAADPCLRELFLELSREEATHAIRLRGLLEKT